MAAESLRLGDNWSKQIDLELEQCDYFLVFLSLASTTRDGVVEEVRRAKELHDTRSDKRPRILPLRVRLPGGVKIGYNLASYLGPFQHVEWQSEADTESISCIILELIASSGLSHSSTDAMVTEKLSNAPLPGAGSARSTEAPQLPGAKGAFAPRRHLRSSNRIGLPVGLQQDCVRVLKQCWEFKDKQTLEPLFGIDPLPRYTDALPLEARSQVHLIEVVIHNLLNYPASKGEPLLLLLLVLRDKREQAEAEWKQLDELWSQLSSHCSGQAGQ